MKNIIYIIFVLLVAACANDRKNESFDKVDVIEDIILDDSYTAETEELTYQNLYTEKLQDYFDLLYVLNKHPEFYEDIKLQLEGIVNDSSLVNKTTTKTTIEAVEQIGDIQILSDSVSSIHVRFKKVSENETVLDSLKLIITKRTFNLDDVRTMATKVMFSKLD